MLDLGHGDGHRLLEAHALCTELQEGKESSQRGLLESSKRTESRSSVGEPEKFDLWVSGSDIWLLTLSLSNYVMLEELPPLAGP